ncbi:unnamed protein product [Closterium sp. Naga37s-1]|nr:unnamed protein product [Closterium sp. Naga37s-1]
MVLARVLTGSVRRGAARSRLVSPLSRLSPPSSTRSAINTARRAASRACSGAATPRPIGGMPPLLPFSAAGAVASSSTLAGVAGGVVGSPSGVACGACKQQMAEGSDSSASGPVAHVSEQQSGLLEGTRRGLEEAERSRAAELVQVKGELLTVRGEVVTVRGGLLTTRGELATMKGELDLLKGTLLETRKDLAEQKECLQKVETEKLASEEEEVKELGKGMISNDAAAVPSPALKHVEFDVEEELRMRQGAYKTVWQP